MLADVWVVLLQLLVEDIHYLHELGHLVHVDAAPLVPVQNEDEAPEDFLLVLDVHEEHGSDVVESLNVAHLGVVVRVRQQDVEELVLGVLRAPGVVLVVIVSRRDRVVRERPRHVLLDSVLVLGVVEVDQLLVNVLGVIGFLLLHIAE